MDQAVEVSQRTKLFTMRMNDEEQARLHALSSHYGISVAAVLRMLVKERADAILTDEAVETASRMLAISTDQAKLAAAVRDHAPDAYAQLLDGSGGAMTVAELFEAAAKKSAPKK